MSKFNVKKFPITKNPPSTGIIPLPQQQLQTTPQPQPQIIPPKQTQTPPLLQSNGTNIRVIPPPPAYSPPSPRTAMRLSAATSTTIVSQSTPNLSTRKVEPEQPIKQASPKPILVRSPQPPPPQKTPESKTGLFGFMKSKPPKPKEKKEKKPKNEKLVKVKQDKNGKVIASTVPIQEVINHGFKPPQQSSKQQPSPPQQPSKQQPSTSNTATPVVSGIFQKVAVKPTPRTHDINYATSSTYDDPIQIVNPNIAQRAQPQPQPQRTFMKLDGFESDDNSKTDEHQKLKSPKLDTQRTEVKTLNNQTFVDDEDDDEDDVWNMVQRHRKSVTKTTAVHIQNPLGVNMGPSSNTNGNSQNSSAGILKSSTATTMDKPKTLREMQKNKVQNKVGFAPSPSNPNMNKSDSGSSGGFALNRRRSHSESDTEA